MNKKVRRSDFTFLPSGFGAYEVTYESPATGKAWTARITDMTYIDATKNADEPTQKALRELMSVVKNEAYRITKLNKYGDRVEVEL